METVQGESRTKRGIPFSMKKGPVEEGKRTGERGKKEVTWHDKGKGRVKKEPLAERGAAH